MKRTALIYAIAVGLGIAAGTSLAFRLARQNVLRQGAEHLSSYAGRVLQVGADSMREMEAVAAAVKKTGVDRCSDSDLASMRDLVFKADHVKEVGRVHDGRLLCSSSVGKQTNGIMLPRKIDMTVANMHFYAVMPLAFSRRTAGLVMEQDGVLVVLNPIAYDSIHEPPMYFAASLFEPTSGRVVHVLGRRMPLRGKEAAAGSYIEKHGTFYKPACSTEALFCIAVAESRADMLAAGNGEIHSIAIAGGLLGGAVSLIPLLWHQRSSTMLGQLRRAVRRESLSVVYQPVVNLDTGAIVSVEALVRWVTESGESVRPDVFIPLAEENGFIGEITRLVLRRVIHELGTNLLRQGMRVNVNMAATDLDDPAFEAELKRCIEESGLPPSAIGLELTERSTANQVMSIQAITKLSQSGFPVYIDDFGTGYSSLSYLHQLPVFAIKIDRAFTQTIGTEAVTASVVPQILQMAETLNLTVVVEGIETEEQAAYFRGRGLPVPVLGQGWLFGRPMPSVQLRQFIRSRSA
jgi:sensor c-di-GMP phosphodiesterase-like protein